jgi:hypothetical protein
VKILDKLNASNKAWMISRAKFNIKYQKIAACIFIFLATLILILEVINKNFAGGIFAFIILFVIGILFWHAYNINIRFLIKMRSINKSQLWLIKNYLVSFVSIFKK